MELDALVVFRVATRVRALGWGSLARWIDRAGALAFRGVIAPDASIGEGTCVRDGGLGLFISDGSHVGKRCLIEPHVSIGEPGGAPAFVGDFVRLGAGAKIAAGVHVGDFSVVGPNTVVTEDVPPATEISAAPAQPLWILEVPAPCLSLSTNEARAPGGEPAAAIAPNPLELSR